VGLLDGTEAIGFVWQAVLGFVRVSTLRRSRVQAGPGPRPRAPRAAAAQEMRRRSCHLRSPAGFGLVEGDQASDWFARPGDDDLVATCNALEQPAEMRFGDVHIHRLDHGDFTLVDQATLAREGRQGEPHDQVRTRTKVERELRISVARSKTRNWCFFEPDRAARTTSRTRCAHALKALREDLSYPGMGTRPVTVTIDERKLARLDGWVRAGRYENRSRAIDAALDLLERRNARPTLEWALAHPLVESGSAEWEAAQRESAAIDRFFDSADDDVDAPD